MKYVVRERHVHIACYEVDASNPEQAITRRRGNDNGS